MKQFWIQKSFLTGTPWAMRKSGMRLNMHATGSSLVDMQGHAASFKKWKPFSVDEPQEYYNCVTVPNKAVGLFILG